jgi:hypothetical protein
MFLGIWSFMVVSIALIFYWYKIHREEARGIAAAAAAAVAAVAASSAETVAVAETAVAASSEVSAGDAKSGAWCFSGRALPVVNRTVSRRKLSLGWTWPRCASWTTFFEQYGVAPASHS